MKITQQLISREGGTSVSFELDLDALSLTTTRGAESSSTRYGSLETLVFGYERAARELFEEGVWVDLDGRANVLLDIAVEERRSRDREAREDLDPIEEFGRYIVDQLRETIERTKSVADGPIDEVVFFFDEFRCCRVEYDVPELPIDGDEEELRRLSWKGLREEGTAAIAPKGDFFVEVESRPDELDQVLDGSMQPYDVPYIVSWAAAQLEAEVGFPIYVTFVDDGSIDFGARVRAQPGESLASFLERGH